MSQSPEAEADKTSQDLLGKYRNAWSALSQLIGMGRSFSGHERNCCFLNNTSGRFADVSAAVGLDLIDDGRAVAMADWDGDGDLDLWLANRTAPRVRLMRNDSENGHHWLAIRLRGSKSNRDAIGARVEMVLDDSTRLIRTLHAGDGYLAQSTKWLHFGLGDGKSVRELTVAWPGGERESIGRIDVVDRLLMIVEGDGLARPWSRPADAQRLVSAPIKMPTVGSASRTWIVGRVPLPTAPYQRDGEGTRFLDDFRGQPLLVNLWSATCTSCVHELTQWTEHADRVRSTGLEILALCVDEDTASSKQLLKQLSFPFPTGQASSELIQAMEVVQRTFLEKQSPLPVPSSFLLDRFGGVAAIYKGPVELETITKDMALVSKSRTEQRDAAVPFHGRWASQVFRSDPRPIIRTLDLADDVQAANAYTVRYIEYATSAPRVTGDLSPAAGYKLLGDRKLSQGDRTAAIEAFGHVRELASTDVSLQKPIAENLLRNGLVRESLEYFKLVLESDPADSITLYNTGLAEMGLREFNDAVQHFRAALRIREDDADTHFHLANGLQATGSIVEAIDHLRRAMEIEPDSPYAANNLAWILATHPDGEFRNGNEAVALARRICEKSKFSNASTVATLAAALAESEQFEVAVKMNQRATDLVRQQNNKSLLEKLLKRQKLYESNRAFRDTTGF